MPRSAAAANASSPHGHQSTGLSACCKRYGLVAPRSRSAMLPILPPLARSVASRPRFAQLRGPPSGRSPSGAALTASPPLAPGGTVRRRCGFVAAAPPAIAAYAVEKADIPLHPGLALAVNPLTALA